MVSNRDEYGSATYGHGEVDNYIEPRRPRGPSNEEVRRATRAEMWRRVSMGTLATALTLMVAATGYTAYAIRVQQVDNAPLIASTNSAAQDAHRATDRIEECTTPGRKCFDDSQARLAQAVGGLSDTTLKASAAAAACAAREPSQTYKEILACVTDRLSDKKVTP